MTNINNYDVEGIEEDATYELWRFIAEEFGDDLVISGDFPIDVEATMTENQISIIKIVVFNEDSNFANRGVEENNSYLSKDFVKELEKNKNINLEEIVNKGINIFWNEVFKLVEEFNLEDITEEGKEEIELQKKEFLNYLKIWLYYNLNENYQNKIEEEKNRKLKVLI